MTGTVICFAAARTARTLRQNAPPDGVDSFVARMVRVAREQSDSSREDFWREVARLAGRARASPAAGAND